MEGEKILFHSQSDVTFLGTEIAVPVHIWYTGYAGDLLLQPNLYMTKSGVATCIMHYT
jgi:hypothetical protein